MSEQPTTKTRALHVRQPTAIEEFGEAICYLPLRISDWWFDGHARSAWLRRWEEGNCADEGARPLFYADDTVTLNSYADYKLWRALGFVADGLILLLVLTIVLTVALALI
jgi:hypothetical protein